MVEVDHVLAKHPEAGRLSTKDETNHVIQVERRRRHLKVELFVILLIKKLNLLYAKGSFPTEQNFLLHFFLTLFNYFFNFFRVCL